ncbi:Flp family type IVb pilin [Phenylobacterium sp. LjRoot225]|uniref:Flp family type IVb pilin n=1 Tax=Phenylobacterium sp. LjRoot225 TaxID=3342285 RepID=UPI003ECF010C
MLKTYIAAKTQLENLISRLARDDSGASLVEYSVLIGIITVGAVTTIGLVGTWVAGEWVQLEAALP